MKKLIAGLFVAALMATGLVAFGSSPAQADCPYQGCIETYTTVKANPDRVKKGNKARICVRVETVTGQRTPRGRITVKVTRSNGGYRFIDSKRYDGGLTCIPTSKLKKKGGYVAFARYDRAPGSPFEDSNNTDKFRVGGRR